MSSYEACYAPWQPVQYHPSAHLRWWAMLFSAEKMLDTWHQKSGHLCSLWPPTGKTGRRSLLNRPSCSHDDQISQGTNLNWALSFEFNYETISPPVLVSMILSGFWDIFLVFNTFIDIFPVYFSQLLTTISPSKHLRSSSGTRSLCIPLAKTGIIWSKILSSAGPTPWKSLTYQVRHSQSTSLQNCSQKPIFSNLLSSDLSLLVAVHPQICWKSLAVLWCVHELPAFVWACVCALGCVLADTLLRLLLVRSVDWWWLFFFFSLARTLWEGLMIQSPPALFVFVLAGDRALQFHV